MLGKLRNTVFFHCFFAPGASKSRLAKAAGMEPCGKSSFQVRMYKTRHVRTTFGSWKFEKWRAAVARNTFVTQNAPNTSVLDHCLEVGTDR